MKRSDLICENGVINAKKESKIVHNFTVNRTECCEVNVDKYTSEKLGKPEGRYVTIYCGEEDYGECFTEILKSFIPDGKAFVAGLGNERICSDSLGAKVLKFIPATAHLALTAAFQELKLRAVSVIGTSVTGKTGIESTEQIRWLAEKSDADFIIAVDCLACSETDRLCRTIQITDTGISPGAGVGNNRKKLDKITAGRKVIAVGVPTVIDFDGSGEKFMVTPRNIDVIVDEFAEIIGKGISRALNPTLSDEEINALIIR